MSEGIIDNPRNRKLLEEFINQGREMIALPELKFEYEKERIADALEKPSDVTWVCFCEPFDLTALVDELRDILDFDSLIVVALTEGIAIRLRENYVHTDIVINSYSDLSKELNNYEPGLEQREGLVFGINSYGEDLRQTLSPSLSTASKIDVSKWEVLSRELETLHVCSIEDIYVFRRMIDIENYQIVLHGDARYSKK